jgi:hypothetical protein
MARRAPTSPWLGRAVEHVSGAIGGKVLSQCGFTMPAQGLPLGDCFLTVQKPARIEPFTEHTGGMAHTSLLAIQVLCQERSKMRTHAAAPLSPTVDCVLHTP